MSLDDQARQSVDTLVARTVSDLDRSLRGLAEELLRLAQESHDAALVEARAALASEQATHEEAIEQRLRDARAAARADVEAEVDRRIRDAETAARAEAAAEGDRRVQEAVTAARADVEAEVDRRIRDAETVARAEAAAEGDHRVREAVTAARAEAEDALRSARETADEALRAARAEADRRVSEVIAAQAAGAASLTAELEVARAESARAAEVAAAVDVPARAGERESRLAELERLRDAVVRLDEATSLKECLDTLGDALTSQTTRSMLFVVRGDWLRAWRLVGFDAVPSADTVVLPLEGAGDLLDVVNEGARKAVTPDGFGRRTHQALAFARLDPGPVGLAVPVLLGGKTVAVVYADDGGAGEREVPGGWPEAVEILARHTSRSLEALTAAKSVALMSQGPAQASPNAGALARATAAMAAGGVNGAAVSGGVAVADPPADEETEPTVDAARCAALLVSEIKGYNQAALRVGRHRRDIRSRLRAEIARARRLYDERVPAALPDRDETFEQELVRVLADGQPDLLGPDARESH
jgi:hypothetical protein